MKVHVNIVTWNQSALLAHCVDSLRAASTRSNLIVSVTVVDNNSEPSSRALIDQLTLPTDWIIIRLEQNIGYAAALNEGLKAFDKNLSDYTILMNDDCVVPENFFSALQKHVSEANSPAIIGFPIRESLENKQSIFYGMRYWPQLSYALPVKQRNARRDPGVTGSLYYPCGALLACRTDFLARIQGVPSQNFLYFEELNLMKRASQCDETASLCDSTVIDHIGGASTAGLPQVRSAHYYSSLAALRFTLNDYPAWLPTVFLTRLIGTLLRVLKTRTLTPARSFSLALKDFLKWPRKQVTLHREN